MALDGLRREFPELFRLARSIPNPRVARAPLLWPVLAASGAGLFVGATAAVLLQLLFRGSIGPIPTSELASAAAAGAALAVAWTSGGREAVIVYAGIFFIERALALPGSLRFCLSIASASPSCSLLGYVLGFWPQALGVGMAYGLVRWMRVSEGDRNPLLEAAGALGLTHSILAGILAAALVSTTSFEAGILFIGSAVAAGTACGLVLLRRVPMAGQWRALGVIALAVLGPWLIISVPQFLSQTGVGGSIAIGGLSILAFASPLLEIGTAALVLYMAAARRLRTAPE